MHKEIVRALISDLSSLPTDIHAEGPFYRPDAPHATDLYPPDSNGPILWFGGQITGTSLEPVANASIETWHADERGRYDNDDPNNLPHPTHFRCRGIMSAGQDGRFKFRTVLPANYPVDPAGTWVRVKHLHFKLYKLGYQPLTTEIALLPDPHARPMKDPDGNPDALADALFDPALVAQLEPGDDDGGRKVFHAYFNFVLVKIAPRGYALHAARFRATR